MDAAIRAGRFVAAYQDWLRHTRSSLPAAVKFRRALGQLYRSKGERMQIAEYYSAEFTIDVDSRLAQAG
jgi:hypothetical protein